MAKSSGPIPVEPDFSRDDGESLRFALWASHNTPRGDNNSKESNRKGYLWKSPL
jgi:hypothetical protein